MSTGTDVRASFGWALFDRVMGSLTPPAATVLTFVCVSLIGGVVLYATEYDRMVFAKEPYVQTVLIHTGSSEQQETHTFVRDTEYKGETFVDCWFTSTSGLCVTGLTSTDFSKFTLAGQITVLVLIQMGGLGIVVFTSIFAMLVARGLSRRESFSALLAGVLDTDRKDVERMIRHVVMYTLFFEGLGVLILGGYLQYVVSYVDADYLRGVNPWWWAVFHAVSAFNNAGFALLHDNLMRFALDPVINHTIASLIILGGLGYPVLIAFHAGIRKRLGFGNGAQARLEHDVAGVVASPVQVRVAVTGTLLLLAIGTFVPLAVEWDNPMLSGMSVTQKIMVMYFQGVSPRTAGFNTVDIGGLKVATLLLYMVLMYIGTNPAGTGGGVKISTVAILMGYFKNWFREPNTQVMMFGHRVDRMATSYAIRLVFGTIALLSLMMFAICIAEATYLQTPDPTFNVLKVVFEIVSAFGTVGLSMGFPGSVTSFAAIMTPFSKVMLIVTMLVGRVGLLTILTLVPWSRAPVPDGPGLKYQIG